MRILKFSGVAFNEKTRKVRDGLIESVTTADAKIHDILMYFDAFDPSLVIEAIKLYSKYLKGWRSAWGWTLYTGDKIPDGVQWRLINGKTYVWSGASRPQASVVATQPAAVRQSKADLSPSRTDKHCPLCGEEMLYEPICPGCALGRMGFAGRYICMDNDADHQFYVTRPGVELANR